MQTLYQKLYIKNIKYRKIYIRIILPIDITEQYLMVGRRKVIKVINHY
jgi:hypothetical protein